MPRLDTDDLDRQDAEERLRERDWHREPRWSPGEVRLQRWWAVRAELLDKLNAAAGEKAGAP